MKIINEMRPCHPLHAYQWLLLLLFSLAAGGCIHDSAYPGEESSGAEGAVPVTIRLVTRFGGEGKSTSTRGTSEEEQKKEGRVDNVYVFFLYAEDNKVHSVVKGRNLLQPSDTETTFSANLEVKGSAGQEFRCIVIANAGFLLDMKNLNSYKGKTYVGIQQMLVSNAYTTAPAPVAGDFVMWGEAQQKIIASRRPQNVTVSMVRALARVDIGLGVNPEHWDGMDGDGNSIPFELKKVFIFKPNDRYAFMPVERVYDTDLQRVTLPSPAGGIADIENPFAYQVPAYATSLTSSVYLPEADIRQGADAEPGDLNHTNRCAIVVGGSYNGHAETYYRIDFRNGTVLVDLLRNHRYLVSIRSVQGDGEATPEEAYETRRVNIAATVLGWNDWSQDVYFDGVDHVYVKQKNILLPGNAGQAGTIGVESNVEPEEWRMSLDGMNFYTDATIANDDFEVTRPAAKTGGSLLIRTRTALAEGQEKSATLTVVIHRLVFSIHIVQKPDTSEEWADGGEIPKEF